MSIVVSATGLTRYYSVGRGVFARPATLKALDGVDVEQVQIGSASMQYDPAKRNVDEILEAIRDQGFQPNPVATA